VRYTSSTNKTLAALAIGLFLSVAAFIARHGYRR